MSRHSGIQPEAGKIENLFCMCLTIPKKVTAVSKDFVEAKPAKGPIEKLSAIIDVKKGDWVLSLNNVIIKKISKKEAAEINQLTSSSKYPKKGKEKR